MLLPYTTIFAIRQVVKTKFLRDIISFNHIHPNFYSPLHK